MERDELKSALRPDDSGRTGKAKRTPESKGEGREKEQVDSSKPEVKARMSGTPKTQALETRRICPEIFWPVQCKEIQGPETRTRFLTDQET